MNINIVNVGHYRATDYGRGNCALFNRETDEVMDISQEYFQQLMEDRDVVYWAMYEAMWIEENLRKAHETLLYRV
jgi:hypothetical protein